MAQNIPVVFGDNDHTSSLPRHVIGSEAIMSTIAKSNGTLILEGPQSINDVVRQYYDGNLSDAELPSNKRSTYHANNPHAAQDYQKSVTNIFIHGKAAGARIFFPESDSFYDVMSNSPHVASAFKKIMGSITSAQCAGIQAELILGSLTFEESSALMAVAQQLMARLQPTENKRIAATIIQQPGPYVVLYGDGHRKALADALHAQTIVIMPSESAAYQGITNPFPDYIYYADSDRVQALTQGSKERAAFVAKHTNGNNSISMGDVNLSLGKPLTAAEAQACLNALPSDIPHDVTPPMPTPSNPAVPAERPAAPYHG